MRIFRLIPIIGVILSIAAPTPVFAESRIKDIVQFEGVRGNKLVGYGLVVGLAGTGDSLLNAPMTLQSLEAMLERLGINTRAAAANFNTKNVAAVMVTADLPAFAASGSTMDVSVSAMGDAKSLQGGTLLVTPLLGADGQAYAVAQGSVETGSISAGGASGSTVSKGVPTAGRIAGGANIEREVGFKLESMSSLRLSLRNPDFTTAARIAEVINAHYPDAAVAENPTIVTIKPPGGASMVDFVTAVEDLEVEPEAPAKVVIDEVAGVIVMGEDVRVS
ncbi:MAG TPA: flagellar basal body P-ring protein FlgI, partial [Caulobacteraceae bacterium]|nr:flagellar basal body P-ring protein FlgI [Caulobacteraceae bacterium]